MTKTKRKSGEKFTDKYDVETATIYKSSTMPRIPPPGHFLYDPTAPTTFDPLMVAAIDRDGKMTTAIEAWTDPDDGILWSLDGRGRCLNVDEVNRRRAAEGKELVKAYIVPFHGDEKAAVARVREKNYHRRLPTPSGMALDILAMRNAGHTWDSCAAALHVATKDAEQWGRKLLPIAHCVPEVRAAIDAGEIAQGRAREFGGSAPDGSKALGKKEQLALLAEIREKSSAKIESGVKPLPAKTRERVVAALSNGESAKLSASDAAAAKIAAAALAFAAGDVSALGPWPKVAQIAAEAMKPLQRGPKPKSKGDSKKTEAA